MDKDKDIQYYPKVTDIVGIPTRDSCNGATKLLTLTTHVLKSLLLFFFFFNQIPQNLATKCQVCSAIKRT